MEFPDTVLDDATRLHKSVVIAKSGIYKYARQELAGFSGLDAKIPDQHTSKTIFNVFRPPEVLDAAQKMFIRQPATVEHPPEFITSDNYQKYAVGWTGDSVRVEKHANGHDVMIRSSLNLLDKDALNAYDEGIREVSPGYKATFAWQDGETMDGLPYQIVMKEITEVNHLALTEAGRGGKDASITDSKGDNRMDDLLKGLKKLLGLKDRVLDSIPKTGPTTDEQKEYLLKEMARFLHHRASGGVSDSFLPEGFVVDAETKPEADSPEGMTKDTSTTSPKVRASTGEKPLPAVGDDIMGTRDDEMGTEDGDDKVDPLDKGEPGTTDTVSTEEEKGFADVSEHPTVNPVTEKPNSPVNKGPSVKVVDSKPGSHLASVSSVSDSVAKTAKDFDAALRSGKLHTYLKESK